MWKFEVPNMPTLAFGLVKFVGCLLMMMFAIKYHSFGFGVLSLILNMVQIEFY